MRVTESKSNTESTYKTHIYPPGYLQRKMCESGLSAREIAESISVNPATVKRWMKGKHAVPKSVGLHLAIMKVCDPDVAEFDELQLNDANRRRARYRDIVSPEKLNAVSGKIQTYL